MRTARYNEKYKEFDTGNRCPNYLRKENICKIGVGEGVRGLVGLNAGIWRKEINIG